MVLNVFHLPKTSQFTGRAARGLGKLRAYPEGPTPGSDYIYKGQLDRKGLGAQRVRTGQLMVGRSPGEPQTF